MWSIEILSFLSGLILVLLALTGGGFEIKNLIQMPMVSVAVRVLCAITGMVLICMGILIHFDEQMTTETTGPGPEKDGKESNICNGCFMRNFDWTNTNGIYYNALLIFNSASGTGIMRLKIDDGYNLFMVQETMMAIHSSQTEYLFIAGRNAVNVDTSQPIDYWLDSLAINTEGVWKYHNNVPYETRVKQIDDSIATVTSFGFKNADLNF